MDPTTDPTKGRPYELDKRAVQRDRTKQCWWLSLLEAARASGKLEIIFKEGGRLHAYYGGKEIPAEGELPEVNQRKAGKVDHPELEVYGPKWQRMIMFFLWDKNYAPRWRYGYNITVQTSDRKKELEILLDGLGVNGLVVNGLVVTVIALQAPTLIGERNASKIFKGLLDNQRVLVDKREHSMCGIVKLADSSKSYKRIEVYNPAKSQTQKAIDYILKEVGEDEKRKLVGEVHVKVNGKLTTQKFELNWILPLTFP